MQNTTISLQILGAALLLAPFTSSQAQSTWQTVDALIPWQGRAMVADSAGRFVSLAIDDSTSSTGPVSTAVSLSTDAGASWQTVGSIAGYALKLTATPDGTLYASGNRSATVSGQAFIWSSSDLGATWTVSNPWAGQSGQFLVLDLAAGNSGAVYIAGYIIAGGTVIVLKGQPTGTGGIAWGIVDRVTGIQPQSICVRPGLATQPDEIVVCGAMLGNNWAVRRSSDGGTTWVTVDSNSLGWAYGVVAGTNFDIYAIGKSTESVTVTNVVTNLVHHQTVVSTNYTTTNQPIWLVRKSANDGATWSNVDSVVNGTPAPGSSLMIDTFGRVFALGSLNSTWLVRASTDAGATWINTDAFLPLGYTNSQAVCAACGASGNICVVGFARNGTPSADLAPIRRLATP